MSHDIDVNLLVEELREDNRLYRAGKPRIVDSEYDKKIDLLRSLAPSHEYLHRVEGESTDVFGANEVQHAVEMLSTEKAKTDEAILRFIDRVESAAKDVGTPVSDLIFRMTPKLDGLAGNDINGKLVTRGNGQRGFDVTRAFDRGLFPVGGRGLGLGEMVMPQAYFDEFLSDDFEDPRNVMVGIVGADELNPHAVRALDAGVARFVPYSTLKAWEGDINSLRSGFRAIEESVRDGCEYPIDGVVLEALNDDVKSYLGATSHHYRWQLAIKPEDEEAIVTIIDIIYQTGRTGQVTPVLETEPVKLSGATISRITAHHAGMVREKSLGPGAVIRISRAGKVIPKLVGVEKPAEAVRLPGHCPSCGADLEWKNDYLHCPNALECPAQQVNTIVHFFSVLGNVDLFGPRTAEKLVENGITDLKVIYSLTAADFEEMGFGPGQSTNLVRELTRSRQQSVEDWRFLAAMGIPNLGKGDSRRLLKHIPLSKLFDVTERDLLKIRGFGSKTSPQIAQALVERWELIDYLVTELRFNLTVSKLLNEIEDVDSPVSGLKLVFTGKMVAGSRDEMKERAIALGATVQSSLNSKTDWLVYGENAGDSKIGKAEKLGVKQVPEAEYLELIGVNV